MSRYALAKACIAKLLDDAGAEGYDSADAVEALIVIAIERLNQLAGKERTVDALRYELENLGGTIDTVFLSSR